MLDFLFFDADLALKFAQRAESLKTQVTQETTPEGGFQVQVLEDPLEDAQREQLEIWYDELFFGDQADLINREDKGSEACGVQIQLASGAFTTVLIAPDLMGKLLSVLDGQDIQQLFNQIADAVETPRSTSVCQVMQCAVLESGTAT
jgi:hypothetical protein